MTMSLLQTFRSLKPHNHHHIHPPPPPKHPSSPLKSTPASSSSSPSSPSPPASSSSSPSPSPSPPASQLKASPSPSSKKSRSSWSVYLILSTNAPIKTYVGVTTNFSRRLKQHNGELKGGAKASRSGRPWVCACIIRGFKDQSEACELESKWKNFSRKLPRKRKTDEMEKNANNGSILLLQHRQAALSKVKGSLDCSHLEIDWKLNTC